MIHPDMTIPPTGLDTFAEYVGRRLDNHPDPWRLERHYTAMVKDAMEANCNLLAWECAKAAAHWRRIADERNQKDRVN